MYCIYILWDGYNIVSLRVSQTLNPPLIGEGGGGKEWRGGAGRILLFSSTVVAFFNGFKPEPLVQCSRIDAVPQTEYGVRLARVDNSSLTPAFARRFVGFEGSVASTRVRRIVPENGRERSKRINSAASTEAARLYRISRAIRFGEYAFRTFDIYVASSGNSMHDPFRTISQYPNYFP